MRSLEFRAWRFSPLVKFHNNRDFTECACRSFIWRQVLQPWPRTPPRLRFPNWSLPRPVRSVSLLEKVGVTAAIWDKCLQTMSKAHCSPFVLIFHPFSMDVSNIICWSYYRAVCLFFTPAARTWRNRKYTTFSWFPLLGVSSTVSI